MSTERLELTLTRTFDAPSELVFRAWTDPDQARHWSGPRGFTALNVQGDLRVGGTWRLCLRPNAGGPDLWQGGVYREIVEPERLVYTFAWDDAHGMPPDETLVTITFTEHDGQTRMTFHQVPFRSVESRDGHHGGWSSAFDRLGEYLDTVQQY